MAGRERLRETRVRADGVLARPLAGKIGLLSLLALAAEPLLLFPFCFQPGWANGWPGLSKRTVFAGFFTGAFVLSLLLLAGTLAPACAYVERVAEKRIGWWCLTGLTSAGLLAGAALAPLVFQFLHDNAW